MKPDLGPGGRGDLGASGAPAVGAGAVRVVTVDVARPGDGLGALFSSGTVVAVVGSARGDQDVVAATAATRPDVVVVDLVTARGGLAAVEQVMAHVPTPTLVVVPRAAAALAARALAAGAADVLIWAPGAAGFADALEARVRTLRGVVVIRHPRGRRDGRRPASGGEAPVIALVASTGGPAALATVLAGLAAVAAPVLVVQHIHPDFVDGLAHTLAAACPLEVVVAAEGDVLRNGVVWLAPGGRHLKLGSGGRVHLDPQPVTLHRPSGDQLLLSVAAHAGSAAVAAVLTGMGDDGARGLLAVRQAGGATLAQDRATCAVFGMPAAAQRLGATQRMLPIGDVARALVAAVRERTP